MNGEENGEQPEGWAWVEVEDVTESVPNARPDDEPDREFAYVDISSIDNQANRITATRPVLGRDAPSRARRPIRSRDVLFSNVRPYLRNIAIVPDDIPSGVCSTGFTVLRSNRAVEPNYLFRYALTAEFLHLTEETCTGTHYPATSDRAVMALPLPLPPLAEQRRIVAAVEAVLARVNAARDRLNRVPAILKRFRQSVLSAACSGRLTADWREENQNIEPAEDLLKRIHVERAKRAPKRSDIGDVVPEALFDVPVTWEWVTWHDLVDWVTYGFSRAQCRTSWKASLSLQRNTSTVRGSISNPLISQHNARFPIYRRRIGHVVARFW